TQRAPEAETTPQVQEQGAAAGGQEPARLRGRQRKRERAGPAVAVPERQQVKLMELETPVRQTERGARVVVQTVIPAGVRPAARMEPPYKVQKRVDQLTEPVAMILHKITARRMVRLPVTVPEAMTAPATGTVDQGRWIGEVLPAAIRILR